MRYCSSTSIPRGLRYIPSSLYTNGTEICAYDKPNKHLLPQALALFARSKARLARLSFPTAVVNHFIYYQPFQRAMQQWGNMGWYSCTFWHRRDCKFTIYCILVRLVWCSWRREAAVKRFNFSELKINRSLPVVECSHDARSIFIACSDYQKDLCYKADEIFL